MDNKLSYLRKYLAEPKVLATPPPNDPLMAGLPEWWHQVLQARGADRIDRTLQAWEAYRDRLPLVFDFLANHLRRVNLLTNNNLVTGTTSIRLLYEMEKDGETIYHAGGNPAQKPMSARVRASWNRLPADFRQFYDSLHNGWYYLASDSMGPLATESFSFLDEWEWGSLEDIGDAGCNLSDLLTVYTNGSGGYVTLNTAGTAPGDVLWWHGSPPQLNIDLWAVIDAWTKMGLDE